LRCIPARYLLGHLSDGLRRCQGDDRAAEPPAGHPSGDGAFLNRKRNEQVELGNRHLEIVTERSVTGCEQSAELIEVGAFRALELPHDPPDPLALGDHVSQSAKLQLGQACKLPRSQRRLRSACTLVGGNDGEPALDLAPTLGVARVLEPPAHTRIDHRDRDPRGHRHKAMVERRTVEKHGIASAAESRRRLIHDPARDTSAVLGTLCEQGKVHPGQVNPCLMGERTGDAHLERCGRGKARARRQIACELTFEAANLDAVVDELRNDRSDQPRPALLVGLHVAEIDDRCARERCTRKPDDAVSGRGSLELDALHERDGKCQTSGVVDVVADEVDPTRGAKAKHAADSSMRVCAQMVDLTDELILALDQGTTSTRAALVTRDGQRLAEAQQAHAQHHPSPGWVEHDAMEIVDAIGGCAREVLAGIDPRRVLGVGITNQRETTVLWDRTTGEPLHRAVVWQDTRTAAACATLVASGAEPTVRERTGLPIQPYFSATKLAWLLDEIPGARRRAEAGELAAGTIDSWLAWSLTGGTHVTDVTNASRTLLLNTQTLEWDDDLLELFAIPRVILPRVVPSWSSDAFGQTDSGGPLGIELPLLALVGDQQAALLGQACVTPGSAKCTFGTGAFLLVNAGTTRPEPGIELLAGPAYQAGGRDPVFCLEGAAAVAGSAVRWLAEGLELLGNPAESEEVAASVPDSGGVRLVPAFQGLYAPWWDASARGSISGLTLHSTRAHLVRATLEALAFQTRAIVDAAEARLDAPVPLLRIDGGATANRVLVQTLADALGRPVERALDPEATVRGAAFAAGLAAKLWDSEDALAGMRGPTEVVKPIWSADRRETEYGDWLRAVERTRR
jgi:glycerol kinase